MKRRMLTVVLAALFAVLGTVAVLAYVHQANVRAERGLKTEGVLVASGVIPANTKLGDAQHQGLLKIIRLPVLTVPKSTVFSVNNSDRGLVVSAVVQPGQLLLTSMLVPATLISGGIAIPPGDMGVTMQLCVSEAVAGYVAAGSHVAIFDTTVGPKASVQRTCDGTHQAQPDGATETSLALPNVEVLSIGQAPAGSQSTSTSTLTVGSSSSQEQGTMLITVAVSKADALKVILMQEAGLPYLGLLPGPSTASTDSNTP